jgi:hypothetical protein
MSWDIVLLNPIETVQSIEEIGEVGLEPTDFSGILESAFSEVIKDDKHREIRGNDFSIDFIANDELSGSIMLGMHGENGLYELIELAKQHGWIICDTASASLIDLDNPENNGFENHRKYVEQIMKNKNNSSSD